MTIVLAIILGIFFGFALQRVGATNPQNIINMLRIVDLHLMKAIFFAIGISSTLLFLFISVGLIDAGHLSVKSSYIGVVVGGAILGLGFAVAGYCPGTGLAALADGRKDAFFFVGGGLLGALIYTLVYGRPTRHASGALAARANGSLDCCTGICAQGYRYPTGGHAPVA